jgi:hypothetical protein
MPSSGDRLFFGGRACGRVVHHALMRAIIASISAEQGPARLADVEAANATALNASILVIFMALSLVFARLRHRHRV